MHLGAVQSIRGYQSLIKPFVAFLAFLIPVKDQRSIHEQRIGGNYTSDFAANFYFAITLLTTTVYSLGKFIDYERDIYRLPLFPVLGRNGESVTMLPLAT